MTDLTRTLDALEFAHSFFEARAQMATPGSEGAGKLYECAKGCADAIVLLKAQEPVVHGRWIEYPLCLGYVGAYSEDHIVCSNCKTVWSIIDNDTERFDYCPHCGAKMDG